VVRGTLALGLTLLAGCSASSGPAARNSKAPAAPVVIVSATPPTHVYPPLPGIARRAPPRRPPLPPGTEEAEREELLLKREFDTYVCEHNSCTTDSDCTVVGTDCPFGCDVVVRRDAITDVKNKHVELLRRYEETGHRCAYMCNPVTRVTCLDGRCVGIRLLGGQSRPKGRTRPQGVVHSGCGGLPG